MWKGVWDVWKGCHRMCAKVSSFQLCHSLASESRMKVDTIHRDESSDQNPGYLLYRRDYTTQLCEDCNRPL